MITGCSEQWLKLHLGKALISQSGFYELRWSLTIHQVLKTGHLWCYAMSLSCNLAKGLSYQVFNLQFSWLPICSFLEPETVNSMALVLALPIVICHPQCQQPIWTLVHILATLLSIQLFVNSLGSTKETIYIWRTPERLDLYLFSSSNCLFSFLIQAGERN